MKDSFKKVMNHKKLSLGLANCAVIKSYNNLPKPIIKCPYCGGDLSKKSFWNWFRSEYNADGYDLPKGTSIISIQSSLMFAIVSNKCNKCKRITKTKDVNRGIERFNRKEAYKSIFSGQLI